MFCSNCGTRVEDDASFCQSCGSEVLRSKPPSKAPAGKQPLSQPAPPPAADLDDLPTQLETPAGQSPRLIDGRLQLLETLGEGGMGTVWKARDVRLGRVVALKRPKGAMLTAEGRARFMREAQACARLAHPNIITIYAVGEDGEGPYLEMEYIAGSSLREMVRASKGGLDEKWVRGLGQQLCGALALAHSHGIIHRDIKPANILLTQQRTAKLGDFGLAAAGEDMASVTASGAVMGTLFYASPEQLRDIRTVDPRSDVYSLAATLYFALTGEDPRVIRLEKLPATIRPVLQKALEEEPANRFGDMAAFEKALVPRPPVLPPEKKPEEKKIEPPRLPVEKKGGPPGGGLPPPGGGLMGPPKGPKDQQTAAEPKKKKKRTAWVVLFIVVLIVIGAIQQATEREQERQRSSGKFSAGGNPPTFEGATKIGPYGGAPTAPPLGPGNYSKPASPPPTVNMAELNSRAFNLFNNFKLSVQQRFMMLPLPSQYSINQGLLYCSGGNMPAALICFNQAAGATGNRDPISIFFSGWCNFFLSNTTNFNAAMAAVRQLDNDGTLSRYVDESVALSNDLLKAQEQMNYSNLGFGSFQ